MECLIIEAVYFFHLPKRFDLRRFDERLRVLKYANGSQELELMRL